MPGELKSAIELKDNDKVNVVLSLHGHFRDHIQFWHDQVYKAATWSIVAAYALVAYRLEVLDRGTLSIILALIVLVGTLSGLYLKSCEVAYRGNWDQIVNCERALRLYEVGLYVPETNFFGRTVQPESDAKKLEGIHAEDFSGLRLAHFLAIVFAVGIMLLRVARV